MTNNCTTVIFTNKAYNELIRESFAMDPVETGGILLGYVINGTWVVMEVVPPGYSDCIHERAYFEYDQAFVNYLIPAIANRYKDPLQLLGLWHRHPGSMDYFSSTDDETNANFASNSSIGAISGLVNIDPDFRLTMYHLDHFRGPRPRNVAYSKVNIEVGDDFIPEEFFALRYLDGTDPELHPTPTHTNTHVSQTRSVPRSPRNSGEYETDETAMTEEDTQPEQSAKPTLDRQTSPSANAKQKPGYRKWLLAAGALIIFIAGGIAGLKAAPLFDKSEKVKTEKSSAGSSDSGNIGTPAPRISQQIKKLINLTDKDHDKD